MSTRLAPPSSLARMKPLISSGLREAAQTLPPGLARIVSYHLGWQDELGRDSQGDGGKALRPTLTLLSAEAVGARADSALRGAVAVELVHNFSLLHDDVMDGDRERRHRPTVWALFGLGQAIIAGDALLALAQRHLLSDERPQAGRAAEELNRATAEMIEGQAEDLAFESRIDVSLEECVAMVTHKTAALLSAAASLGAILGGGDEHAIEAIREFGRNLGIAFQAIDDILGIWGDPAVTGKPAANDLRQRKKTIPMVHALESTTGEELRHLLSNGEFAEEGLRRALVLMEESGSREWALDFAERHFQGAGAALDTAALAPEPVTELRDLARFVVGRDF